MFSRRHFLKTASGGLLAIPLLPSLLSSREAHAALAPKRFIAIHTHNSFHPAFMFPEYPRISTTKITSNGLDAHVMPLSSLSGPISYTIGPEFDPLRGSMMVLRGFEALCPKLDHNFAYANSGMSDCDSGARLPAIGSRYPTIDQHIKKVIYADGMIPKIDILSIQISWASGRPACSFSIRDDGGFTVNRTFAEPAALWQALFGGSGTSSTNEKQKDKLVADKVLEHYRAVISNPRLSSEDKRKLDTHIARLTERQSSIFTGAGCEPPLRPTFQFGQDASKVRQTIATFIELIVAALECDLTRVVVMDIDPDVLYRSLDPHRAGYHDMSHGEEKEAYHNITREQLGHVASLWSKLQASQDVDGKSILYNTLSLVTKEMGDSGGGGRTGNPALDRVRYAGTMAAPNHDGNHDGRGMVALIGGHAGGLLKPGKYIDYTSDIYSPNGRWKPLIGPPYGELLISTMVALGVPGGSWEPNGQRGYGDNRTAQWGCASYEICPKSADQRSMLPGWGN